MVNEILKFVLFWGIWLIIPLVIETFKGVVTGFVLLKYRKTKKFESLDYFPMVTIIVPVYNSRSTLQKCLESIAKQSYPLDSIEVFLVDNGSKESSYDIFEEFQSTHAELKLWWYYSDNGKSRALNKGIFSSNGKYIINIDSDGWLDKNAITNIVKKFESDLTISALSGAIVTSPEQIKETKGFWLKTLRLAEFYEYVESFFVGANFNSFFNTLYTLSGAFSCFRKEALIKTQMYNGETLGEDTHMTFQIKKFVGGKVLFCSDAFYVTEPIEEFNKLYTQRQRWQRSEIEIAKLFAEDHVGGLRDYFHKFTMRLIVSDHTLAFMQLQWLISIIYFFYINYPSTIIIGSNILLYLIYVLNSFVYLNVSAVYMKSDKSIRKFMFEHWYIQFLMPIYRNILFFVRLAGIINSSKTNAVWKTRTFSDEMRDFKNAFIPFQKNKKNK